MNITSKGFAGIGCNIVHPLVDSGEYYTETVYSEMLGLYQSYSFSHVEFSHVCKLDLAAARRLRDRAGDLGLTIWSLHSEHLNDLSELSQYYRIEEHCAQVAGGLGCQVMVCHLPNIENRGKDLARDAEIIAHIADACREHGVSLGIEPCWDDDVCYILKLIATLSRSNVGVTLDTGHIYCYISHDVGREIRRCGAKIISVHLQDNYGENDDHQMPGLGSINWPDTVAALFDVGYSGPLLMEMTGSQVKARRTVKQLTDFALEKELVMGSAYLRHLWKNATNRSTISEPVAPEATYTETITSIGRTTILTENVH